MQIREYLIAVIVILAIALTGYSYLSSLLLTTVEQTFNLSH